MPRIGKTVKAIPLVAVLLLGTVGCTFQAAGAPAANSTLTPWSTIRHTVANSIQPTLEAFPGSWDVERAGPSESVCWSEHEDLSGTPAWKARSDGYETVYLAKSLWFDIDEDPWTTAERYARVWKTTFPTTNFDPDHESFTYGAQLAGLFDSEQLRVTGGFDGDTWVYLVEVSCDTPGFRASAPGTAIDPFTEE